MESINNNKLKQLMEKAYDSVFINVNTNNIKKLDFSNLLCTNVSSNVKYCEMQAKLYEYFYSETNVILKHYDEEAVEGLKHHMYQYYYEDVKNYSEMCRIFDDTDWNYHPSLAFLKEIGIQPEVGSNIKIVEKLNNNKKKSGIVDLISEEQIFFYSYKDEIKLPEVRKNVALAEACFNYFEKMCMILNTSHQEFAVSKAFICAMYFANQISGRVILQDKERQKMLALWIRKYMLADIRENVTQIRKCLRTIWIMSFLDHLIQNNYKYFGNIYQDKY